MAEFVLPEGDIEYTTPKVMDGSEFKLPPTDTDEESPLFDGAKNFLAGVNSGVTGKSFSASSATLAAAEEDEPSFMSGRLFTYNPEGEIEAYQNTQEWLGVSQEQWDGYSTKQRRKMISERSEADVAKFWDADTDSTSYMFGEMLGMFIDPSTLTPMGAKSTLGRVAIGAAVGGTDLGVYEAAQEGAATLGGVATGVALGGGLAGVLGKFAGKSGTKQADEILDLFQERYLSHQTNTDDVSTAVMTTLKEMGINSNELGALVKGSMKHNSMPTLARQDAIDYLKNVEKRNIPKDVRSTSKYGKGFDSVFQPVSDRMKAISPKMWMGVQDQQRKSMNLAHKVTTAIDPYLRKVADLKKVNPTAYAKLNRAMFESSDDVPRLTEKYLGVEGTKDLGTYRDAMDRLYKLAIADGEKIGYRKNYFARWVTDRDLLRKSLGEKDTSRVNEIIKLEEKRKNRGTGGLTSPELDAIYNKYMSGGFDGKKSISGAGGKKHRRVRAVSDEVIEKAYADPITAANSYARQMATDIYLKKMFGKGIVKKHGDNLGESVGAIANRMNLKGDDIEELKTLFDLVYIQGNRTPNKVVRTLKDYGYASMLGNPMSALTQIGDIFISASKVGTMNTVSGLSKAISGKGLTPSEFGMMDNMLEELISNSATSKKWLDRSLKWGGFRKIDEIGKATLMNGSLKGMHRQAQTAKGLRNLRKKWSASFGDDWPAVENALKNREITPDIKSMVFSELADVQPITKFEMPEQYLKHPEGRVLYMLRTFTMKFMNLLRRDMVDMFRQGDFKTPAGRAMRKQAIKNGVIYLAALNAGGITSTTLKELALGRDVEAEEIVAENLWKSTGLLTKYSVEKMGESGKPVTEFAKTFVPAVGFMDPYARAAYDLVSGQGIKRETPADIVKTLPIIGRLFENYFMGGLEESRRR